MQTFLSANRAAAKTDLDEGLFGKRTAGKKVGKLFRATDEIKRGTSDEHSPTTMGNRLNGVLTNGMASPPPKVLTMVTRRSNSRRTVDRSAAAGRKQRTPAAKVVEKEVDEDVPQTINDDEDEDVEEDDEMELQNADAESDSNSDVEPSKQPDVHTSTEGKMRARRESAKRINYAEPREDDEMSMGAQPLEVTKSKKIEKLRLRSIRWRPPSQGERSGVSQPFYKVVDETASGGVVKHRGTTKSSGRLAVAAGEARSRRSKSRSKESMGDVNGEFDLYGISAKGLLSIYAYLRYVLSYNVNGFVYCRFVIAFISLNTPINIKV